MTKKTFTKEDKKGRKEVWEWDETPEVLSALEKLRQSTERLHDDIRGKK